MRWPMVLSSDSVGVRAGVDEVVDLSDNVMLEAANEVALGFSFGCVAGHLGNRELMETHSTDHDTVGVYQGS